MTAMFRQFTLLTGIGILNIILFIVVFRSFQNEKIYQNSLGIISENYERTGSWPNYEVKKVSKPFLGMSNANFLNWDASIYKCISERMYEPGDDCYGNVRAAFFPLFPLLWKITFSSPVGISVINYLLFIVSVAVMVMLFLKTSLTDKLIIYSVLITLPSTIIFYIPYTESLFLATMTITAIGILKKNYGMFFAGSFLMSLVRPATVFVLIAIALAEIIIFIKDRAYRSFINALFFRSLPFLAGYFCAIFIQYLYTGSWTAMLQAQKQWEGGLEFIKGISDWSVEGFGLSSFAVFFVCLPVLFFIFYLFVSRKKRTASDFIAELKNFGVNYLLLIAAFYLAGIFVFILLTSGGNLHSFFRFTLASPFFFLAAIFFLNYLSENPIKKVIIIFIILTSLLALFLHFTEYGGERMQFSFSGLYLFIATALFLIIRKKIPRSIQLVIVLILILLSTVWNTFLLNAFFSDAWIFT